MAVVLTGGSDHISIPDSQSIRSPSDAITAAVWYYRTGPTPDSWAGLLYKLHGDGQNGSWSIQRRTNQSNWYAAVDDEETGTIGWPSAGQWLFIVLRWESGDVARLEIYNASGDLVDDAISDTHTGTIPYTDQPFLIGRSDVETSHAGMYAGVYLHGERLTDGQVEALHAATVEVTTGGVGSPPITPSGGYWPLLDDADDASGNGNHGTAVDDPDFVDPDTPGGSVSHAWVGACTDSGFTVSCKIDGPADARLAVDTDDGFSDPIFSTVAVDADGWTKLTVSGLAADTTYHWAIELDSELEETPRGAIRTFPPEGEPASFVFAAGSCNVTGSTAVTHGRIRDRSPLLMLQMGDLHYEDPDENDPAVYREAWEAALASETQAALYQNVPVAYMWDDHDWAPNDGDGSHVGRPAALTAYREVVPHYPISFAGDPDDTPVGQTFVAGRVRFVVLDTRSESDFYGQSAGNGIMIGETQLAWLLDIIETFTERLLVITVQIPWIVTGSPIVEDDWGHCRAERQAISDAIQQHAKGRVLLLHGDAHMVAMDDGTNTNFATNPDGPGPPLFAFAPLDQQNSTKGGPYSEGTFTASQTQYGIVEIDDDGTNITVTGRGFRADTDAQLVSHQFVVDGTGIDWGDWSEVAASTDPGGIAWGDWSEWATTAVAPPVDPEVPAEVPGSDTSGLTDPADRAGKGQRWQWWTGDRWDAVLPTGSGWAIYTDLTGDMTGGPVVDNRQAARVDTVWHDGTLWVARGHTSAPRVSRYVLDGGTYVADETDVALPAGLAAASGDASPLVLLRSTNGRLWVACNNGSNVVVAVSDDDGDTWDDETVLSVSETGVAMLAQTGDTIVLLSMLNDGGGRAVRTIDQDAADISSGEWSPESLPALPGGISSDDHGMAVSIGGHIYATSKTEGASGSGDPLLYLLHRDLQGDWSATTLRPGPDAGDTRPHLVGTSSTLYVAYGRHQAPTDVSLLAIPRDTLTVPSPDTLLDGGNYGDSAVPPRAVSSTSGLLWLAHDRDSETIWRVWQPVPADEVPQLSGGLAVVVDLGGTLNVPTATVPQLTGSLDVVVDLGGTLNVPTSGVPQLAGSLDITVDLSGTLSAPTATVPQLAGSLAVVVDLGGTLHDPSVPIGPVVDLHFIALAPETAHGLALAPELAHGTALAPETVTRAALAPELVTRQAGDPELGHGTATAEVGHGFDLDPELGHGQVSEPTL